MARLRFALPLVLLVAGLIPTAATAGPAPINFAISSNAQYVGPTEVLVQVTVTCEPAYNPGSAFVNLFQNDTGARGSGFAPAPCTGSAETVVVAVTGAAFVPGRAYATGSACTNFPSPTFIGYCDSSERQLQIDL